MAFTLKQERNGPPVEQVMPNQRLQTYIVISKPKRMSV